MQPRLKKLNPEGVRRYREYIRDGAQCPAPIEFLESPDTSEPLPATICPAARAFRDRYEFGCYLNELLNHMDDTTEVSHDQGFWTALALFWFDLICPPNSAGKRSPDKEYRYVLSSDYRHYYQHLVRSPWHLARDHGKHARFLLISPKARAHPLSVHGEILEQFGGRQQVLRSRPIIAGASRMYFDETTSRPRRGAAGSGRGSARRFSLVLRQLDLTYDPECMSEAELLGILPTEFDRWKASD